jgi:hypothetical protein
MKELGVEAASMGIRYLRAGAAWGHAKRRGKRGEHGLHDNVGVRFRDERKKMALTGGSRKSAAAHGETRKRGVRERERARWLSGRAGEEEARACLLASRGRRPKRKRHAGRAGRPGC